MKILILSNKLPYPPNDGGAIGILGMSRSLAAAGFEICFLTHNTKKHYFPPEKIPAELSSKIRFITVDTDTGIKAHKLLLNLFFSRRPYIAERFYTKAFEEKLTEILSSETFDIIQFEIPYMGLYLPLIRKYSDAKISLRAHNVEHEIWERHWKNERRPLQKLYTRNLAKRIKKLELQLVSEIDYMIAVSERDRKHLLTNRPEVKSMVQITGIDPENYSSGKVVTTKSLFFLGSLEWMPNQEGLLWFKNKVIPVLDETGINFTIHIAGRNAPESLIQELSHPRLIFHGEVEDARAYMNMHSIMIAPLLTGSGIRIKILEGMAMSKCVVTTSIGAEGIPVEDGKHLLIGNDGTSFAQRIIELLENEQRCLEISANARQFVQDNFDTFAIASRLKEFFKN